MSRPAKYAPKERPIGVSLRLSREILDLSHGLGNALPGASATDKLQGVLTRGLLRERDELAIGGRGHLLRPLPSGGLELVLRVSTPEEAQLLHMAAQWFEQQLERINQHGV